jgi:haloacetate dehalogenase
MFEGFTRERIRTSGAEIDLVRGGSGPPLLLLHGYPQTKAMWHKVAPGLAAHFTVIAPDLRGYGASSHPPDADDHRAYSKRAMATDQVETMGQFGFPSFFVAGHDRGGRVAYRLALDHAERVTRLAVLDIVPTYEQFAQVDRHAAKAGFHWYFLAQPRGFPERLIGGDPEFFLRHMLGNPPPAAASGARCSPCGPSEAAGVRSSRRGRSGPPTCEAAPWPVATSSRRRRRPRRSRS